MARDKRIHGIAALADRRRHIDGEKIARADIAVYGLQVDVIRIHVIRQLPAQFPRSVISRRAHAAGLRTNDVVLAVRLIPDWNNGYARRRRHPAGFQLRLGLMRETVAYTKRVFPESKSRCQRHQLDYNAR